MDEQEKMSNVHVHIAGAAQGGVTIQREDQRGGVGAPTEAIDPIGCVLMVEKTPIRVLSSDLEPRCSATRRSGSRVLELETLDALRLAIADASPVVVATTRR